ncbi:hypothetical protein K3G39_19080 [Pontibacter sp. HSC-14F20]|nr:hypothetical protein [Pontibacter sp. HSC-14F20]MBX0335344.1 hypothetical protein [Pontibacter sp. HSC-14F20]
MKKVKLQLKKQIIFTLNTQPGKSNKLDNVFTTGICTILTTATETSF